MVGGQQRWQRLADVAVAGLLLVLIFPLALFVAAVIFCGNPGPILERRLRVRWNGQQVKLLTFRTAKSYVGNFLRYSRINTLPELINVLFGDIGITESSFFD
jgi:lipopolysaccharide/colanic/teichoic acid biosynthesis glycosyltransferase